MVYGTKIRPKFCLRWIFLNFFGYLEWIFCGIFVLKLYKNCHGTILIFLGRILRIFLGRFSVEQNGLYVFRTTSWVRSRWTWTVSRGEPRRPSSVRWTCSKQTDPYLSSTFSNRYSGTQRCLYTNGSVHHRRRIYTEENAKVVTAAWGTEYIQYVALAILHQNDLKIRMKSSYFKMKSSLPWVNHPVLQIVLVQNS